MKRRTYDLCDKINKIIEAEDEVASESDIANLKLILERHRCDMSMKTSELLQELDYVDSF